MKLREGDAAAHEGEKPQDHLSSENRHGERVEVRDPVVVLCHTDQGDGQRPEGV